MSRSKGGVSAEISMPAGASARRIEMARAVSCLSCDTPTMMPTKEAGSDEDDENEENAGEEATLEAWRRFGPGLLEWIGGLLTGANNIACYVSRAEPSGSELLVDSYCSRLAMEVCIIILTH